MKKLFFIALILISFQGIGQVYQYLPQYGYQMNRIQADSVLKIPSDTIRNKSGIARIGTTIYAGNGTYWTAVSGGSSYWQSSTTNNIDNTNSGNVGIGNTNPQYKLDVTGTINSTGNISTSQTVSANGGLEVVESFVPKVTLKNQSGYGGYFNLRNAANQQKVNISSYGDNYVNQPLAVGNSSVDASAQLDITASSKGLLIPRLTTTQRNNITTPATGLLIWNTTDSTLQQYRGLSGWSAIGSTYSAGYGLSLATTTFSADSLQLSTKAWRQKGLDSLGAITALKSTTLSNGWGLLGGGDLSANRTYTADTVNLSTKANGTKQKDSVVSLLSTYLPLSGGTMTGNLLFSADNTKDIGASGATRPRNIYVGNNIIMGQATSVPWTSVYKGIQIGNASFFADSTTVTPNSSFNHTVNANWTGTAWQYMATGSLPTNYYQYQGTHNWRVAGSGTVGGTITWKTPWQIGNNGNFLSPTDNTYDIGASGATRPRNIYVGTSGYFGTSVGIGTTAPTSALHTTSFATAYTASAVDITATIAHQVINLTATGKTVTLPTAVGITGRIYTIKLTAVGTGTVDANASETIDNALTYTLGSQYKYVSIQSDGAGWIIIANN